MLINCLIAYGIIKGKLHLIPVILCVKMLYLTIIILVWGYLGYQATLKKDQKKFLGKGMRLAIKEAIIKCDECQRNNMETVTTFRLFGVITHSRESLGRFDHGLNRRKTEQPRLHLYLDNSG